MAQSSSERLIVWGKIVAQCWNDDRYKARLLSDPRATLAEAGYELPEGMTVSIVEQPPNHLQLGLPPRPASFDGKLGDEMLEVAAG